MIFIFFNIIIKQVSNYAFPVEKFNVEFIAMIGITTIEEKAMKPIISSQLCWLFMLCFFASLRYKFLLEDPMKNFNQSKDEDKEVNMKTSRIIRNFQKLVKFLQDLYQYYMLWVYHIFFNLILIYDHKDLLSTLLFVIESATLIIHISLWKRGRKHDYEMLYKTWYLTFIVVIFYALIRYLLFFLKYSTVNYFLKENDTIREICSVLVGKELMKRETRVTDSSYVINNYMCPLLLLTLGVFTRSAFHKNLQMKKKKKSIVEKTVNLKRELTLKKIEEEPEDENENDKEKN